VVFQILLSSISSFSVLINMWRTVRDLVGTMALVEAGAAKDTGTSALRTKSVLRKIKKCGKYKYRGGEVRHASGDHQPARGGSAPGTYKKANLPAIKAGGR
jgi:hypothetical protein